MPQPVRLGHAQQYFPAEVIGKYGLDLPAELMSNHQPNSSTGEVIPKDGDKEQCDEKKDFKSSLAVPLGYYHQNMPKDEGIFILRFTVRGRTVEFSIVPYLIHDIAVVNPLSRHLFAPHLHIIIHCQ